MKQLVKRLFFFALLAVLVLNVFTTAARLPDSQFDPYYPAEADDTADMELLDEPMKRGLCRKGFAFQAVLRQCLPSKGILRGRGRGRGRRF